MRMEELLQFCAENWDLPAPDYIHVEDSEEAAQWNPILQSDNAQCRSSSFISYAYAEDISSCAASYSRELHSFDLIHGAEGIPNNATAISLPSPVRHAQNDVITADSFADQCLIPPEMLSDSTESYSHGNVHASTESLSSPLHPGHMAATQEDWVSNALVHSSTEAEYSGLRVVHLLIACAEAISAGSQDLAEVLLLRLSGLVSPIGSTMERVAYYLVDYINSHYCCKPGDHAGMDLCSASIDSGENLLGAFRLLHQVYPYIKIAHFTANQSILEALAGAAYGHRKIHIIDFDIMDGMQWPPLMQTLASEDFQAEEIRISAVKWEIDSVLCGSTGRRLLEYANSVGIAFSYEEIQAEKLGGCVGEDEGAAVVVNCMWQLPHMCERRKLQVEEFLQCARRICPVVLTSAMGPVAECETTNFVPRFAHCLQILCAVFDSLEAQFPLHGLATAMVERIFFGPKMCREMMGDNSEDGEKAIHIPLKCGFEQGVISIENFMQANALLFLSCAHVGEGCYAVELDGQHQLILKWGSTPLIRVSTWKAP